MSTVREPTARVAAYRALQNEPMRASALFGPLTAFEAPKPRDLPPGLEPARAPIRAARSERLRLTLASGVAAGLAWALAVLALGIAITRDPGTILGFALASTPVFALGMAAVAWFMNAGIVIPVDAGETRVWQSALAAAGFAELTWTTSRASGHDIGTYRPPRGLGRVFLFEADEGVSFLAGPLGRMVSVAGSLLEAEAEDAA